RPPFSYLVAGCSAKFCDQPMAVPKFAALRGANASRSANGLGITRGIEELHPRHDEALVEYADGVEARRSRGGDRVAATIGRDFI
ncbi:MAG: hypothetical protein ACJ8E0_10015, partial [Sphingomicrobium sp.]